MDKLISELMILPGTDSIISEVMVMSLDAANITHLCTHRLADEFKQRAEEEFERIGRMPELHAEF